MIRIKTILLLMMQIVLSLDFSYATDEDNFALVFPLMAPRISSKYGFRVHPIRGFSAKHQGVDLAAPENSPVRAITSGRVVFAGNYAGYGKLVTIEHKNGKASLYAHLSKISIKIGENVDAGKIIGEVGSTGISTGPHLHFEWRDNGVARDPLQVFPFLAAKPEG